ncbi:MAG: DUF4962 domain-containing protein, partial [Armatimonadetes bacterium]|nr:DUF4962 domain-containing protein [Armatimonadota bacterium]
MRSLSLAVLLLLAPVHLVIGADELVSYDFEQGPELAAYKGLQVSSGVVGTIVAPGAGGQGHCLLVETKTPSPYASITLRGSFEHRKNLTLSFDYRAWVEPGKRGAYVGLGFYDTDGKSFFGSVPFVAQWQHAEVPVASVHPTNEGTLHLGQVFNRINLYARSDKREPAKMKLWVDNVRLGYWPAQGQLTDRVRVSTANPPFFNWGRSRGTRLLQYSRSPKFPADATEEVKLDRNWYLPPHPLQPGTWYWRVYTNTDLREGWSDIERIEVLPEAIKFQTPRVAVEKLARRPHPRLLDPKAARRGLSKDDLADLVRKAERSYKQGVPDDCPVWVKGDPRWPTWIEWYGKAHGGITSRTGNRLEDMARICIITNDPKVREWTRQMALKAAAWDPNGGSARNRGDIGAQHFLRGLNWCYDALHDYLSEEDRARLRQAIIARTEQFWHYLNPFHSTAENNHAWLQTFVLGQSGLVMLGEVPEAEQWLTYSLDLYIGRFLCALGYQGDDNEGISYWAYGLGFIRRYADMMLDDCGVDLYRHPWLRQTDRFPLYCAPPNAWAVSFADTGQPNHGVRGPAYQALVRALAERARDPYGLWYAGVREPVDGVAPRPPVDLPQSIWYRYIGWVIFNTSLVDGREDVTFAMRSGPYFAGHQHEDLNGFVLHAYGAKLAIDSGHYDYYGSPHHKDYSTLTRAHNCILVNGEDQHSRKRGADGRIAAYFDSPAFGYTVGDVSDPDVYNGQVKRFDRRVLFIKPGFVVLHDVLEATQGPARWDWLLHAVSDFTLTPDTQSFAVTSGGASLAGRFLAPGDVQMKVTKGYPVQPVDRYSTRPLPPEKWVDEWTMTATPAQKRKQEDFFVVMAVTQGAPAALKIKPQTSPAAFAASFDDAHGTTLVVSSRRDASGPFQAAGVSAQGQVACVRLDRRGNLRSGFLAEGTELAMKGQVLLRADNPASLCVLSTPDGKLLTCSSSQATGVGVVCSARPAKVLLDGKETTAKFDARRHLLSLRLPAGEHEVAFGPRAAKVPSHKLGSLAVKVGDKTFVLEGYGQRHAAGLRRYWWGPVEIARPDSYDLA